MKRGEPHLVTAAFRRLIRYPGLSVCCGVPLLGRCVDLVYVEDGRVTTIEFKLRDWRRALRQARDHLLAADYAYICMPKRTLAKEFQDELHRTRVGLAFFSEDGQWPFRIIVQAPKSFETWNSAKKRVVEYVLTHGVSHK